MADDQNCFRCGKRHESSQLTASRAGNGFCPDCWKKVHSGAESSRKCPVDGGPMKKQLVADAVVIDNCATCGGLWFDKGELEVIERKSRDMGWQQGFFTSVLLL